MKASELIKELERLAEEDDPEVVIAIGSHYRSGSLAYEEIHTLNRYTGYEIRIQATLGEQFSLRTLKNKQ